jgi:transcriptional activator of cad operon
MSPPAKLRIGDWQVDPAASQISREGEVVRLEARTLRLLLDLAEHAGQVVSIDDLLDRVWAGVIVTPDSVYQAVAALRRLLGDDPRRPRYIATVPRLGYRMVASVEPWTDQPAHARSGRRIGERAAWTAAGLGVLALLAAVVAHDRSQRGPAAGVTPAQPIAVGVLPVFDLTPRMDHELLADDVTERLIDQLSRDPRLRTPGFRASFQLKGKHLKAVEAARQLGVAYVLEGAVHVAPIGYRVSARLVRGDTGFVIWAQAYERPPSEMPSLEAAIAADVAKALATARTAG